MAIKIKNSWRIKIKRNRRIKKLIKFIKRKLFKRAILGNGGWEIIISNNNSITWKENYWIRNELFIIIKRKLRITIILRGKT